MESFIYNEELISLILSVVAIFVAFFNYRYQKKTYRNTTFLVKYDDALLIYYTFILRKMLQIERFLYTAKRIMETSGYHAKLSEACFWGLKIDLTPLDNSIFYSDEYYFKNSIRLKDQLNCINELIEDFYRLNKSSDMTENKIKCFFQYLKEDLKIAYDIWFLSIILEDEKQMNLFQRTIDRFKRVSEVGTVAIENQLKKVFDGIEDKTSDNELSEKAKRYNREYNYDPIFEFIKYNYPNYKNRTIVYFAEYYYGIVESIEYSSKQRESGNKKYARKRKSS